jgi:hypothetical protein
MGLPLEVEARILTAGAEQAKTQADYDQAKQLYTKALTLLEKAHGNLSMEVAVVCMDIAEMFEESGNSSESVIYIERMRNIVSYQKSNFDNPLLV